MNLRFIPAELEGFAEHLSQANLEPYKIFLALSRRCQELELPIPISLLDLLDPVCLYGSLFVRSFVRVPERSIWSSEFVSHTFESHHELKALYIHFAQCDLCAIPLEMPSMF
jgi:hypothetical protein